MNLVSRSNFIVPIAFAIVFFFAFSFTDVVHANPLADSGSGGSRTSKKVTEQADPPKRSDEQLNSDHEKDISNVTGGGEAGGGAQASGGAGSASSGSEGGQGGQSKGGLNGAGNSLIGSEGNALKQSSRQSYQQALQKTADGYQKILQSFQDGEHHADDLPKLQKILAEAVDTNLGGGYVPNITSRKNLDHWNGETVVAVNSPFEDPEPLPNVQPKSPNETIQLVPTSNGEKVQVIIVDDAVPAQSQDQQEVQNLVSEFRDSGLIVSASAGGGGSSAKASSKGSVQKTSITIPGEKVSKKDLTGVENPAKQEKMGDVEAKLRKALASIDTWKDKEDQAKATRGLTASGKSQAKPLRIISGRVQKNMANRPANENLAMAEEVGVSAIWHDENASNAAISNVLRGVDYLWQWPLVMLSLFLFLLAGYAVWFRRGTQAFAQIDVSEPDYVGRVYNFDPTRRRNVFEEKNVTPDFDHITFRNVPELSIQIDSLSLAHLKPYPVYLKFDQSERKWLVKGDSSAKWNNINQPKFESWLHRTLRPNHFYVRFEKNSQRWILARTDDNGRISGWVGELGADTIVNAEDLGIHNSHHKRYKLTVDGVWEPTEESLQFIIWLNADLGKDHYDRSAQK